MNRTAAIAGTILVAALVIAGVVWIGAARSDDAPAPGPSAAPAVPDRPAGAFPLTVRYVYDGDTIQAEMQQPNEVVTTSHPIRIRLIGIDTPEGTPAPECWAAEARAHLSELLPEGSTVWAAPDRDTWDDYQRRLFHLWTDDGRFVNAELVIAGDAEAIRIQPNVAYFDLFATLEADAQSAGRGRWGACG